MLPRIVHCSGNSVKNNGYCVDACEFSPSFAKLSPSPAENDENVCGRPLCCDGNGSAGRTYDVDLLSLKIPRCFLRRFQIALCVPGFQDKVFSFLKPQTSFLFIAMDMTQNEACEYQISDEVVLAGGGGSTTRLGERASTPHGEQSVYHESVSKQAGSRIGRSAR
jgi:hypothetical protein